MLLIVSLALGVVLLAALPLLVSPRQRLFNPALYVFVIVAWSVALKTLYIVLLRPRPVSTDHDAIYVSASSIDFLVLGQIFAALALLAYVSGYIFIGNRVLTVSVRSFAARAWQLPAQSQWVIAALGVGAMVSFVIYLDAANVHFFETPFSVKRFRPQEIGVASRFEYLPYYFFKLAMTVGSVAYAAALLLAQSRSPGAERRNRALVLALFGFALILAHFASIRQYILLLLFQIFLLMLCYPGKQRLRFATMLAALTAISLAMITFVHRAPTLPEPQTSGVSEIEARADLANQGNGDDLASLGSSPESTMAFDPEPGAASDPIGTSDPLSGAAADTRPPTGAGTSAATPESVSGDLRGGVGSQRRTPPGARVAVNAQPKTSVKRKRNLSAAAFGGRYFMDVAKLAHIAGHFPEKKGFLMGRSFISRRAAAPGDDSAGSAGLGGYLARNVFEEPRNNIPAGYAGELYVNFGWPGVLAGFGLLGVFHRFLYNQVRSLQTSVLLSGIVIVLIVNTTLVLLNSGLIPALARTVIDLAVIAVVSLPLAFRPAGTAVAE